MKFTSTSLLYSSGLSSPVRKLFDVILDIAAELGKFYLAPYSEYYEAYISSISELYLQFKTYFDEECGIKTPTNFKSFESLTSVGSGGYENGRSEEIQPGMEDVGSCETPVYNSFISSPMNDEVSIFSNYTESQSTSSDVLKVNFVLTRHQ